MRIQAGQTALITGASRGLDETFARQFAAKGLDLILVARSESSLQALAAELTAQHGVRVEVVPADLSLADAASGVVERMNTLGLHPNLLINNAGFATYGRFDQVLLELQHREMMVNMLAVTEFCHHLLPTLRQNGGRIINVASRSGFQPAGNMAVYAATKAFVISLSEALWAENRSAGVHVMALCPGAVTTHFFDALGRGAALGKAAEAAWVVRLALRAYERGRVNVVPGWDNYALAQVPRFLPRSVVALITERLLREGQEPERQPA